MSPAFKQAIYRVTGAGLLLAAVTCSADTTNTTPVTSLSSTTASVAAQPQTTAVSQATATPQNAITQQGVSPATASQPASNPYYQNANGNNPQIGSGGHLLNVTLGLMLIIGLIFGLSWFVKRFSQGSFSGNSHLKIVATMPLGTRERIVLIDAGGQQLLLGITPTHINTLHTFDIPIAANQADVNTSDFGRKLMAILQRPNATDDSNNNNNSGIRE
ncbi:MAG: flagellar biosynthetic protein FliO [Cellvibrio sp. 79]|nr:MAG: flagellar biosynthetic protein FliO [Cellvibrio sp. 79]